ncbi:MAG: hypothetical protein ACLVBB_02565 [Dysosmobacter welbionis]
MDTVVLDKTGTVTEGTADGGLPHRCEPTCCPPRRQWVMSAHPWQPPSPPTPRHGYGGTARRRALRTVTAGA